MGAVGPLAHWPVGPLARWPVGPLALRPSPFALGPRPLALDPWPLGLRASGFGLGLANLTFTNLLFFFTSHTEKLFITKCVGHFQGNAGVWLATQGAGCHAKAATCVGRPCGQSAHADRSGFFGTWWFEDTTPMSIARRCAGGFVRVRGRCLSAVGWVVMSACGRGVRRAVFFPAVSLFWGFWHPTLLG